MAAKKKEKFIFHTGPEVLNGMENLCGQLNSCVDGMCCYAGKCVPCKPKGSETNQVESDSSEPYLRLTGT
jgi:hypothetical protein